MLSPHVISNFKKQIFSMHCFPSNSQDMGCVLYLEHPLIPTKAHFKCSEASFDWYLPCWIGLFRLPGSKMSKP